MIVWSGFGFLVPLLTFGACLLANVAIDAQMGAGYYSAHNWTIGSALLVGGVLSAGIGFLLKGRTDRYVVDENTGERFVMNNSSHSFFFVPMHWAGVGIAILGVGMMVSDLFK